MTRRQGPAQRSDHGGHEGRRNASGDGTVITLTRAIRKRQLTAVTAVERALAAVEDRNGRLTAFVHVDPESALAAAHALDRMLSDGAKPGPHAGVPFGV